MAWTIPRTWSPGETVTASLMNAHVRDNLNAAAYKAIAIQLGSGISVPPIDTPVFVEVPAPLTITGWSLTADAVGSVVIDVWKDTWANFPPTVADTIAGTELPTLSSEQNAQDLSLSSWTTSIASGDVLGFNIDSIATCKLLVLTLRCEPA